MMEFKPFENKVWLATPTMHGEELKYMTEAYETNWMSTVGANINEVERIAAEKAQMKYADKIGAKYTLIIGDNEIQSGKAQLKNMDEGTQEEILLSEIIKIMTEKAGN